MSAWMELVGADGSDEWLEKCDAALREVQQETLRRAASKIRRELPETVKERLAGGVFEIRTVPTARQAADLIDPEVD